ncbi:MAG: glycosyltransferase [Pirellulales bacterium]
MSNLRLIPFEQEVARKIHLTFPSFGGMPEILSKNLRAIAQVNPDYSVILYDDKAILDLILDEFGPKILSIYNRINPIYGAARADFFRYLCVYRFGGVYLDIKAQLRKPLSESLLPSDRYILSHWDQEIEGGKYSTWGVQPGLEQVPGGEYQQWHIISCAGHPFLRAVIEAVIDKIDKYNPFRNGSGRNGVIRTTGPVVYTQTIHQLLEKYPFRLVNIVRDFGIDYSIFSDANGEKHRQLFKHHYGLLTEPVVLNNAAIDASYNACMKCIGLIRAVRNRIRKQF